MNTFWIVEGSVSDPEAYVMGAVIGQPEYQVSDGPRGDRDGSTDWLDLDEAIAFYTDKGHALTYRPGDVSEHVAETLTRHGILPTED